MSAQENETLTSPSPDKAPNRDKNNPDEANPDEKPQNLKEDDGGFMMWVRSIMGRKDGDNLRQAIADYIQETANEGSDDPLIHEKVLLSNVLKLRDLTAADVMVPRVDIVSFDLNQPAAEFFEVLAEHPHSRIPVYRGSLDDIVGTVHIKDVLQNLANSSLLGAKNTSLGDFSLDPLIREVPVISPAMPILDLLMQMRESRKHMALVVDEFGGIDGLVTIGDLIETIVGEFYDEYDLIRSPRFDVEEDGTILADARVEITEFEDKIKPILTETEKDDDIGTLGGLVYSIAGRIPARHEVLRHEASGTVFEILDADARRIKTMRIKYK